MLRIAAFPDLPRHVQTVTLAGRALRYRRTYRPRTRSWYVDIFDGDGNPILLGRRLAAGWSPTIGLPIDLGGVLFVLGRDGYAREDLGGELREIFVTTDELPAADTSGDGIREVVL